MTNRHFVDDSIISPGGIPLDYHELPPIKANFKAVPVGLEVNEASYEEYCDALAQFRNQRPLAVDE